MKNRTRKRQGRDKKETRSIYTGVKWRIGGGKVISRI
jgi:hypothetical protein